MTIKNKRTTLISGATCEIIKLGMMEISNKTVNYEKTEQSFKKLTITCHHWIKRDNNLIWSTFFTGYSNTDNIIVHHDVNTQFPIEYIVKAVFPPSTIFVKENLSNWDYQFKVLWLINTLFIF